MKYPGMGDPYKRKRILKFLGVSAGVGTLAVLITSLLINPYIATQPHNSCINDIDTNFKISYTVEVYVDNLKADIPAKVGFIGECQRSIYTLSDDGTGFVEWTEDPNFEIGHFLWVYQFPLRDMDQSKSRILVNGIESEHFINAPLQDGYHYRAEFTSKAYDESKDKDFLPSNLDE